MSSTAVSPTDVIIRLAAALLIEGYRHPVAAAIAQAARMHVLAAPGPFADRLGIDEFTLHRAETGGVAFASLPAAYLAFIDGIDATVDLVGLRELAEATDDTGSMAGDEDAVVLLFPGVADEVSVA